MESENDEYEYDEPAYDWFKTPIVPRGAPFPGEYLSEVAKQGYKPSTHEPLQRYATEDLVNEGLSWWAYKRVEHALDYPIVDAPNGHSLEDYTPQSITYSANPFPNIPEKPLAFQGEHPGLPAVPTTNAIRLPEDVDDDTQVLKMRKALAVGELYKAVCSMPVRTDTESLTTADVRTAKVSEMVYYLAPYGNSVTHEKLSELAEQLYRAVQRLHHEGCTVGMPSPRRRSDKHLTAIQRVEALLQYLSDMKSLVVKCLKEGEDGIAEVVAFPRTLFEQHLNGQVDDSGDEEQDEDADEVDEKEISSTAALAGPSVALSQSQATASSSVAQGTVPASTSACVAPATAPTVAAPTAVQATNTPVGTRRRRLKPKLASNFQ